MVEKDLNYLKRLQRENPALYAQEIKTAHPDVQKIIAQEQAEQEHQAKAEAKRIKRQEAEKQARIEKEKQMREAEERAKQEAERKQWAQAEAERAKQQQAQEKLKEQAEKDDLQRQLAQLQQKFAALEQQVASTPPSVAPSKAPEKSVISTQLTLSEEILQQTALFIRYEDITILKKLGEGAFGEVFYGRWRHHEEVAIKKLHMQQMSENALIEFKEEAAIMACLRSDYIVTLKGVCLTPYTLVMAYMQGGSLFNVLHSQTALPWSLRHRIALDVAKGLCFLHSHQPNMILHRDLKSQNVLLTEYHQAKLADFGLAKVRVESSRTQTHTQSTNKSVGTTPWMAPECFGIRPKYSEKSDIYAYGMILWEIATRKMPYEEVTDANEIRNAVKEGEREEIPEETVNPADPLPTSYKELIRVCWFQVPEKRPTAKKAIEALEIDNPTTSSTSSTSNSSSYSSFFSGFLSNFSSQK
jgi:chemotaxis protein histidine kinase CheA